MKSWQTLGLYLDVFTLQYIKLQRVTKSHSTTF